MYVLECVCVSVYVSVCESVSLFYSTDKLPYT